LRGARDVSVGDNNTVGGPYHAGAIAPLAGEDENGGAAKMLGNFTKIADGHLFASTRAFADNDVDLLSCASAHKLQRERLADGFAVELRVNIFEARHGMSRERDKNVSDDYAGFVRRAFGLDFQDDGSSFFAAL
jgi:hypothetical protein